MLSKLPSLFRTNETTTVPYDSERSIKLILLGQTSVGKTSLALRFSSDEFLIHAEATIGVSFSEPTMIYEDEVTKQKTKVHFKIWDTAGQEKYHALASMYYRGAAAAVIVFDISKTSSFLSLQRWVEELKEKGPSDIIIFLCGNKLDLEASGDRQVTRDEAEKYATEIGASYIETSARDSTNVKELFEQVAKKVPGDSTGTPSNDASAAIQLGARSNQHGSASCCR